LQRAVGALAAAAGLRGIAEDVLDTQAGQRPADLRRAARIGRTAGGRGVDGPVRRSV
jgi:hypothetical protein